MPSKVSTLIIREPLSDCLKDVDLIPPFNRMLLEVTFGKLYSWAIHNVRNILLEASARFKELGECRILRKLNVYYYITFETHRLTHFFTVPWKQVCSPFLCRPSLMRTLQDQVLAPFHKPASSCP